MPEGNDKKGQYIEGTISHAHLGEITLRIGPIDRAWNPGERCDTVFVTETCHPTKVEVRQGENVRYYAMLAPCDTVNCTSTGCLENPVTE